MAVSGKCSYFWEWLGWKSKHIAAHREETRADLAVAVTKLENTKERVAKSESMSNWLQKRSRENHIAEALMSTLDHPRRGRI